MALSILLFSIEMAVNPGWSGSYLVILFQGLWCNEDFGYSFAVAAEELEAAEKRCSAISSPAVSQDQLMCDTAFGAEFWNGF